MRNLLRWAIVAVCGHLMSGTLLAQGQTAPGTITFNNIYRENAERVDLPTIAALSDGSTVVAGYFKESSEDRITAWVFRLDRSGGQMWQKTFADGLGVDSVATLPGDQIVIGGIRSDDLVIRRLDATGYVLWEKNFAPRGERKTGNFVRLKAVAARPDGSVIVLANLANLKQQYLDNGFRLLCLDHNGNVVWEGNHPDMKGKKAQAITVFPDGGFAVAGDTKTDRRASDAWLVRFDATGKQLWENVWGNDAWSMFKSTQRDAHIKNILAAPNGETLVYAVNARAPKLSAQQIGECTLGGRAGCYPPDEGDLWLLRLDARGNVLRQNTYFAVSIISEHAMSLLPDGSVVIAAYDFIADRPRRTRLIRIDASGKLIWEKKYGSPYGPSSVNAMSVLPDGGLAVSSWMKKDKRDLSMVFTIPPAEWMVRAEK